MFVLKCNFRNIWPLKIITRTTKLDKSENLDESLDDVSMEKLKI